MQLSPTHIATHMGAMFLRRTGNCRSLPRGTARPRLHDRASCTNFDVERRRKRGALGGSLGVSCLAGMVQFCEGVKFYAQPD